ncbi:MAG: sulfatase [Anaerolineae bacterium]|nr:sulfatase [Anaerolineae bacterium]
MKKRPNIIFIVLDAVRADHLSCYGYKRATTPTIDTIASEGALFQQAVASAPWTLPSHSSMFTGLFPSEHATSQEKPSLSLAIPTLAELLQQIGYKTGGFSNNPWIDSMTGLNRGFEFFLNWKNFRPNNDTSALKKLARKLGLTTQKRMAESTISHMLQWLNTHFNQKSPAPFFLFVNFMEAHLPYSPPREFAQQFVPGQLPSFNINQNDAKYLTGRVTMTSEDFEMLSALYDGELLYLDSQLERFFSTLDRLKLLEDTFVVITSDHGENLGDHGLMTHIFCLYDTLIRVPLLMKFPSQIESGSIVNTQVQIQDLFSTLLKVAGSAVQTPGYKPEKSILDVLTTPENQERQNIAFAEYAYPALTLKRLQKYDPNFDNPQLITALKCARTPNFKLIWSERGQDEFYNLQEDPFEENNLIFSQDKVLLEKITFFREVLDGWEKSLVRFQQNDNLTEHVPFSADEAVVSRLRDLGYLE